MRQVTLCSLVAVVVAAALGVSAPAAPRSLGPAQVVTQFRAAAWCRSGARYWLAKKRYGNLVLWWYGTAKKIEPTFQRLHRVLSAMTTGS